MNETQHKHSILTLVAGTWTARVYLALCAALLIWATVDAVFVEHEDASLAGVIPMLATAPTSLVVLVLPDSPLSLVLAVTAGALANAALISWCVRALRRGGADTVRAL